MEEVERVREIFAAFNAQEREPLVSLIHPEFEIDSPMARMRGVPYRGREGILDFVRDIEAAWERFELVGEHFETVPAGVFVRGVIDLQASASGIAMQVPLAWLWRFQDGLVRRLDIFTDLEEAVSAAREDPGPPGS